MDCTVKGNLPSEIFEDIKKNCRQQDKFSTVK